MIIVERLPRKCEALSSNPSTTQKKKVVIMEAEKFQHLQLAS
jgi:hypothetical protein